MFRIPNRLLRLRNYQSEQHKIELQNRYTRNFKIIDYLYTLKLTPDQQSRRSSKEEQKKEELLQLKLKKV